MERIPRHEYPWWVKAGIWGVPGRAGMWAYIVLSIALAVACVIYGFRDPKFFVGILFLVSALAYWLVMRWVDQHGSWGPHMSPQDNA